MEQGHEIFNFGGHGVKGQGHRRPKLDLKDMKASFSIFLRRLGFLVNSKLCLIIAQLWDEFLNSSEWPSCGYVLVVSFDVRIATTWH